MGLRDIIRAIREYPATHDDLEVARLELRQAQQALEKSDQDRESLSFELSEQKDYTDFLSYKAEAFQDALKEFCPRLSTPEEMKRFYDTISPSMDERGFTLYRMAKELTGIDVPSCFPYEDNRGLFEEMDGHQLLDWLTAVRFQAVEWEIIPNSTYEYATLREVDTSTPEYCAFEKQLYKKVLERMGFQDILAPEQEVSAIEDKTTELKLYSPLTADLYMEPDPDSQEHADGTELLVDLYGEDLTAYKKIILQAIKDEMLPEMEEQGLMFAFSGSGTLSEKVLSLFPTVEEVDGVLCGAAVCQVKGSLTPAELTELKDFCTSQYADSWGEGYAQRPRHTEDGELYVNFWQDNNFSILTKEELETTRTASRPLRQPKRGGEAR